MNVIDEYLKTVTPSQKKELERVREIVKKTVPEAEEVIGYGMPTFKYKGKNLMHIAAFKNHMSIFPTANPIGELEEKLSKFKVAKGTIQFTEDNIVPEQLIKELLRIRIDDIERKAK